jgi:ERCC4-related helicase
LVGKGKNDSFQRGLVSSSETVWKNPMMGECLTELQNASDPRIRTFLDTLRARLGSGTAHPKVAATTDWAVSQVQAGHHVIVFTVWKETQETLRLAIADQLGDDKVTGPRNGTIPDAFLRRVREPPGGSPVVLVLTDRFSESIDLDGGCPSLVHHDLSWNPVRLTQRWGRVVRVRTGFELIAPERIYIPVLETEVDQRVAATVRGRMNFVSFMVPAAHGSDPWGLPDSLLKQMSGAAG